MANTKYKYSISVESFNKDGRRVHLLLIPGLYGDSEQGWSSLIEMDEAAIPHESETVLIKSQKIAAAIEQECCEKNTSESKANFQADLKATFELIKQIDPHLSVEGADGSKIEVELNFSWLMLNAVEILSRPVIQEDIGRMLYFQYKD